MYGRSTQRCNFGYADGQRAPRCESIKPVQFLGRGRFLGGGPALGTAVQSVRRTMEPLRSLSLGLSGTIAAPSNRPHESSRSANWVTKLQSVDLGHQIVVAYAEHEPKLGGLMNDNWISQALRAHVRDGSAQSEMARPDIARCQRETVSRLEAAVVEAERKAAQKQAWRPH